jgi:hypothetical protein
MPIESRIDPGRRLVVTVAEGTLTGDEVRANQRSLDADPAFDPGYDHLFDLSGVSELRVPSDQLRELAAVTLFEPGSRRAVVAPEDVMGALVRRYGSLRDLSDEALRVFRTLREALAWLGHDRAW